MNACEKFILKGLCKILVVSIFTNTVKYGILSVLKKI